MTFLTDDKSGITFIHSFIPDIYIAPLQETYSEALSVQLRSKRNVYIIFWVYIYIYIYTHTHIYIYVCVILAIYMCV